METWYHHYNPQLLKSFKFGNGSRMSHKKLAILEFMYLQKKNGRSKLKKVLEQGRVIDHTDCFHFTQTTHKNSQFPIKNWPFSTFTMFSLHLWSSVQIFVFLQPLQCQERSNLSDSRTFQSQGGGVELNWKNMRKNMKFWSLNLHYKIK